MKKLVIEKQEILDEDGAVIDIVTVTKLIDMTQLEIDIKQQDEARAAIKRQEALVRQYKEKLIELYTRSVALKALGYLDDAKIVDDRILELKGLL